MKIRTMMIEKLQFNPYLASINQVKMIPRTHFLSELTLILRIIKLEVQMTKLMILVLNSNNIVMIKSIAQLELIIYKMGKTMIGITIS